LKYPYERFLRFLVSRKIDPNLTLSRYGLNRAGDLWATECRTSLRATAPFGITRYMDTPGAELVMIDEVLEWAAAEKILPLWKMQPEFGSVDSPALDMAFRIFVNPFSRALMGMLLMSRARPVDIFLMIKEQLELQLNEDAFTLYKDIFWDVTQVSRSTWGPFVEQMQTAEERNFIAFGFDSPTIEECRDLLGMDTTMDHKVILNQIISKSYLRYKAAMNEPNPEAHEAMKWAELVLKAIGTAKTAGGLGLDNDAARLVSSTERFKGLFAVVPSKTTHPTLAELHGEVGKRPDAKAQGK
jgi:hypothetical protein